MTFESAALSVTKNPPISYRPDIDGLRAIAVLCVVAFHVGIPGMGGGFVGVDVFLVISGFLITSLLVSELRSTGRISLRRFYARRIIRLVPAIVLVLLVLMVVSSLVLHPFGQQQAFAKSVMASAAFIANIFFLNTTGGYFETPASAAVLLHFWSLAVEEQYYIVWPMMLIGMAAVARTASSGLVVVLLSGTCLIAAVSALYAGYLSSTNVEAAYYLMPSRAWQLLVGACLALVASARSGNWLAVPGREYLGLLGCVFLLLSILLIDSPHDYPNWKAVLPTVAAGCIIAAGFSADRSRVTSALSKSPMVFVGKLSYSWYLWHWPTIALAREHALGEESMLRNLVMAILALILAYLTYQYVEKPFRGRSAAAHSKPGRVLMAGAGALVGLIIVAGLLGLAARHASTTQPWWKIDPRIEEARASRPQFRDTCHHDRPFSGLADRDSCVTGAAGAGIKAILWGDSHADHLSPLVHTFGIEAGLGILQRSLSNCRPVLDAYAELYLDPEEAAGCQSFLESVMEELRTLRTEGAQGVILSGYLWGNHANLMHTDFGLAAFRDHLQVTVQQINAMGLKVLLIGPVPTLAYDPLACLARLSDEACGLSRAQWEAKSSGVRHLMGQIAQRNDQVAMLDVTESLCDSNVCRVADENRVFYRDDNHLTTWGAESLLDTARSALIWLTTQSDGLAHPGLPDRTEP